MPSYYIMSLLQEQKAKYGEQIAKAQEELAKFEEGLDVLVGADAAAVVRQHIHVKPGRLPQVPVEGQAALAEVQRLIKQETSITRHLHSFPCCYGDYLTPPHILSCYGIDWNDLQEREEDGVLPLGHVIWLLDIILHKEMRLPTTEALAAPTVSPGCVAM